MEDQIFHNFRITHSYSENHDAENTITGEKVSLRLSPEKHRLEGEISAYRSLAGGIGIPLLHLGCLELDGSLIVTTRLGPSLQDLFEYCGSQLSFKSILLIADQVISRLELMHGRSLVHGDVKPDNFCIGIGTQGNVIYVTGLSSVSAINGTWKPDYKFLRRKFRTLYTDKGYLHDWVFDWTAKRYIGQSSKTATTGEGLVEQPDYGPISQQELQKEVRRLNGSLQGLQDKIEQDYKQNPVAIHPSQFEELLDGYLNVIWALDRLSERQPRPSNDKIAEIMWTIIEQIFGRPEHGMKSDQQSAFFRLAYSTLAVFYVTVPASKTIWALYLKKISERG
ncbi:hypothetical protein MCOR29_005399 [Pyricularia oryzae]|nr:hypothetical protein MCOR29_005399 [Pyricularia oryzae]KAI6335020.1 hypothetical protein MCOR28_009832 [Pyricularia oryzae]KAI6404187.1 hypothetical protein MCOR20_007032 [Pyricularia oryzae]KAI6604256.1 hypothetical protein MCOR12_002499 [Pyricularia oryzae]KAI6631529.1 hypothetical protein MCOR08_005815 [Pyricularia oryzae]